jgi:hypothetical protein
MHDPLADPGGHVDLRDAHRAVGDRDDDHGDREDREQPGAALGERDVDDGADQERVDERDEG